MKTINKILFTLFILATMSCKAQTVGLDAPYDTPDGAYYKDLNNELNKFEGTWTFTDGNTLLTIVFEKQEYVSVRNNYRDYLYGEYKYIEDGVEIVNTLSNLANGTTQKNIGGSYLHKKTDYPSCDDCDENERRIDMYFNDPERSYLNNGIVARYLVDETNPEKIEVVIYQSAGGLIPDENSPTSPRVPYGTYIMEKQ